MIDPASNWFEVVELPVAEHRPGSSCKTQRKELATNSETQEAIGKANEVYFDKSSLMISKLVNKCWFS
jgi:hypothetical protein